MPSNSKPQQFTLDGIPYINTHTSKVPEYFFFYIKCKLNFSITKALTKRQLQRTAK